MIIKSTTMAGGASGKGGALAALILTLLCCMAMWGGVSGGSAAPSPSAAPVDCSSAILGLADCLDYVQEGSKVGKPQKSCCSGLKKVVREQVGCLCEAFKQSASFGVSLNMTKALSLPSACGLHTPPFTKCNIAGGPGAAPAPSPVAPVPSPSAAQTTAPTPASSPNSASNAMPSMSSAVTLLVSVVTLVYSVYL